MNEPDDVTLRPRPVPDALTRPFWDGVARRRLVLQRCETCGHYVHPPYPECPNCRGEHLGYVPVAGRGTIYERAIVASPVVVGFEDDVPYACVLVELDEQPGLLLAGNLVDASPDEAEIGRRVGVVFRTDRDGFTLPMFTLLAEPSP